MRHEFLAQLKSTFDRNVFVMMRYDSTPLYARLEAALRQSLAQYGLIARLAKDRVIHDDLWLNIESYMRSSARGVAVFEEIDRRDFNPNISLELGYMYALGRDCLLLKDKRMPRLPTDTCGKIYRDFDAFDLEATVLHQVSGWCEADLGLQRIDTSAVEDNGKLDDRGRLIYDSQTDNLESCRICGPADRYAIHVREVNDTASRGEWRGLELTSDAGDWAGINKRVPAIRGRMTFEYRAVQSSARVPNMYFCAIPMQADGNYGSYVEVGATTVAEPENGTSPYRARRFVPPQEVGDGFWHVGELEFDFRQTPTAAYTVCGVRINEGSSRPGTGVLQIRQLRIYATD